MRFARHVMAFAMLCGAYQAMAYSPVGEEAAYQLDRARERTSAIIKNGNINVKVSEQLSNEAGATFYKMDYNYDLTIAFMGRQHGSGHAKLDREYFEPAFLERLRDNGEVSTEAFKARYLGQGDVTTMDGKNYAACDLIELYDINIEKLETMVGFVSLLMEAAEKSLFHDDESAVAPIQDLKVKAAIKQGEVPVIGAVKVDVSGVKRGMPVKAGFDYQPGSLQE